MTTLLVVEDQVMLREALAALLDLEPDLDVVGQVGRGDEVLAAVAECSPDVVLLDIELPGLSGLDVAERLREAAPGTVVVVVTTFGRPGYLRRALDAGVRGFVVKDGPVEGLADAVRRVTAGELVIDPALAADALAAGPNLLTAREQDVLRAGEGGATVADIAGALHLSEQTVRNYLSAAIGKTGTRNRTEAAAEARDRGWL
ncbi:response regulator transcription factor [Phycicoccus sonneratiae]|uniref:Response regulator transcription factor n=1 Tax=Phycicoccus sonneratiae TaxID=2807628 RepID=A0ABS2CSY2_9MICO|nr:response regulator transcription factor [Phycicoccus sonneraticus]MBM6402219.1 response regulator transcription factor [Phycicoccus sonneraticus]